MFGCLNRGGRSVFFAFRAAFIITIATIFVLNFTLEIFSSSGDPPVGRFFYPQAYGAACAAGEAAQCFSFADRFAHAGLLAALNRTKEASPTPQHLRMRIPKSKILRALSAPLAANCSVARRKVL